MPTIDSFTAPFAAADLIGWFRWTEPMTQRFGSQSLYHRCHIPDLTPIAKAGRIVPRSEVHVINHAGQRCLISGIFMHLNVLQDCYFGPVEIVVPLSALEGRRFYAFRRFPGGNRHLYLLEHKDDPLVGVDETHITKPLPTLFTKHEDGKYDRDWDERVEIILTEPAALGGATIRPTTHRHCANRQCNGRLSEADSKELLEEYFKAYPRSRLLPIASL